MTRGSCRTARDSTTLANPRMVRAVQTVRLSVFVLLIAAIVIGSEAHGSNGGSGTLAYSSASASASASAFSGIGGFPGTGGNHEGHKGIRSYDNTGYGGNNQQNSGVKGNHGGGCLTCKWEDDDYWEKEEEETEPEERNEDDCYDGDDGQYRDGHGHGSKVGSPLGVQKLGSPNPIGGPGPYAGTKTNTNAASNLGNAGTFGAAPVKEGYPQTGSSNSGSPWNKLSPISNGGTYRLDHSSNRQPGTAWSSSHGTMPTLNWSQGYGTDSHPNDGWNTGPENPSNTDVSTTSSSSGNWNNKAETGSGCFGVGCAQGLGNTGPVKQLPAPFADGSVQKLGSPDYSTNPAGQYNPRGSSSECFGSNCAVNKPVGQAGPFGNVAGTQYKPSEGQGRYPDSGSSQNNSSGSPYGQIEGQEQYPRDESIQGNVGYGPTTGSHGRTSGITGNVGNSGYPNHQNPSSVGNAVSSSVAYVGAGSSVSGNGIIAGRAPTSNPTYSSGNLSSNSPFGNRDGPRGTGTPSYANVKGTSTGATVNAGSTSGAPKNGDSKIFYINVSPAPGSPVGVNKPHATTSATYSGTAPTKPSYQSNPHSGAGTTNPSYQPNPYGNAGTTKPFHPPDPYGNAGTTKLPYQPSSYDSTGITKPSYHQPDSYGGTGSKPSYQVDPYDGAGTAKPPYQFGSADDGETGKPSYDSNPYIGTGATKSSLGGASTSCSKGSQGCASNSNCDGKINQNGSPNYEPCDRYNVPGGINKTPGPSGFFNAYPLEFPQSSQQATHAGNDGLLPIAVPAGAGGGSYGCAPGTSGCASDPGGSTHVDKIENVNKIPGGGSYPGNPFLTGKLPSPGAGGSFVTPTSKPIGHGNPFLQGAVQPAGVGVVAGAGSWSQAGSTIGAGPNYSDKNVPSARETETKPVSKNNPFFSGLEPTRGDMRVDGTASSTLSEFPTSNTGSDSLVQVNGNPSFNDETYPGSSVPSHHSPGSSWNSAPTNVGSSLGVKNPPATNRGTGSGGGVGVGAEGFGNLPGHNIHHNTNPLGGSFSGAISNSQASSYANSYSGSNVPGIALGQAKSGSWASSGANAGSQAGSGSWSSSGASAYASSSANSWAGTRSLFP